MIWNLLIFSSKRNGWPRSYGEIWLRSIAGSQRQKPPSVWACLGHAAQSYTRGITGAIGDTAQGPNQVPPVVVTALVRSA